MSIQNILQYPDKRLRLSAKPVENINSNIKKIISNMLETMYEKEGIGLAAPQINIQKQIIVIDLIKNNKKPLILINPVYLKKNGIIGIEEGCLSIPQKTAYIPRFNYIKIQAINYNGKKCVIEAKKLLSICIQHEMDHLIGKLFIDYLT